MTFIQTKQTDKFPCQVRTIRVSYSEPEITRSKTARNRLDICVVAETVDAQESEYTFPASDLDEAYRMFFDQIETINPAVLDMDMDIYPADTQVSELLKIMLNREANRIAMRTRRRAGDRVIIHPDNTLLPEKKFNGLQVFESEHCPKNKAVIMLNESELNGEYFSPIQIVQAPDQAVLFLMPPSKEALSDWKDFVGIVEIRGSNDL